MMTSHLRNILKIRKLYRFLFLPITSYFCQSIRILSRDPVSFIDRVTETNRDIISWDSLFQQRIRISDVNTIPRVPHPECCPYIFLQPNFLALQSHMGAGGWGVIWRTLEIIIHKKEAVSPELVFVNLIRSPGIDSQPGVAGRYDQTLFDAPARQAA